jgi:hypothetical protein
MVFLSEPSFERKDSADSQLWQGRLGDVYMESWPGWAAGPGRGWAAGGREAEASEAGKANAALSEKALCRKCSKSNEPLARIRFRGICTVYSRNTFSTQLVTPTSPGYFLRDRSVF